MGSTVAANLRSFVLPLTAAGLVPALLLRDQPRLFAASVPLLVAGAVLVLAGLSLLVWTISLFIRVGRGTLAPWNPTQKLVIVGPYAHVRNPMISAVACLIAGEALLFASQPVAIWAGVFVLINHVYFVFSEEPGLVKRFGAEYERYKRNVPRWLLRTRGWHG